MKRAMKKRTNKKWAIKNGSRVTPKRTLEGKIHAIPSSSNVPVPPKKSFKNIPK